MQTKLINNKGLVIGGNKIILIAGPCAVESKELYTSTVNNLKYVDILRGGAFKPRTNPDSFLGLENKGIEILLESQKELNKPVVTELTKESNLNLFNDIDYIQVGARNMQNFELLKALGRTNKTIILKRGFGNTIDELLEAAHYIKKEGNENIVLVERGIRTFETSTRFTLDLSSIAVIKAKSTYPVFVDPSHAAGTKEYVESLAKAAIAAGADGIMIETHINPEKALSDSKQALTVDEYNDLVLKLDKVAKAIGRTIL